MNFLNTSTSMVPITEARDRMKEIVAVLEDRNVLLIRHSRPAAVLLSPGRYEALLSRIEDLEDELAVLHSKLHPEDSDDWEAARARLDKGRDAG